MKYTLRTHLQHTIAEVIANDILIQGREDGLDVLVNLYYQGFNGIILYGKNITPAFFDLQNGMAGDILQKFSNYRTRLAIVGSFKDISSKSLSDFILESNRIGHISFVETLAEAIAIFAKKT